MRCSIPKVRIQGPARHQRIAPAASALAAFTSASVTHQLRSASPSHCSTSPHASIVFQLKMAAIYKPTEAIALLRPTFLLPRIHPASNRRAQLGRIAFSTTKQAQATHTSTPNPAPQLKRKSITLTGDTGQVRWSDLSPGEKAVRTTQQSANLVIVVIGIIATVRNDFNYSTTRISTTN